MTSITSHIRLEVEPTDNEIRNTIIDEGVIKSLHRINKRYVKRVETCGQWTKPEMRSYEKVNSLPTNIERIHEAAKRAI